MICQEEESQKFWQHSLQKTNRMDNFSKCCNLAVNLFMYQCLQWWDTYCEVLFHERLHYVTLYPQYILFYSITSHKFSGDLCFRSHFNRTCYWNMNYFMYYMSYDFTQCHILQSTMNCNLVLTEVVRLCLVEAIKINWSLRSSSGTTEQLSQSRARSQISGLAACQGGGVMVRESVLQPSKHQSCWSVLQQDTLFVPAAV